MELQNRASAAQTRPRRSRAFQSACAVTCSRPSRSTRTGELASPRVRLDSRVPCGNRHERPSGLFRERTRRRSARGLVDRAGLAHLVREPGFARCDGQGISTRNPALVASGPGEVRHVGVVHQHHAAAKHWKAWVKDRIEPPTQGFSESPGRRSPACDGFMGWVVARGGEAGYPSYARLKASYQTYLPQTRRPFGHPRMAGFAAQARRNRPRVPRLTTLHRHRAPCRR